MSTTSSTLRDITQSMTKRLAIVAKNPENARSADYYKTNISKVKTAEEFVNNYKLFSFAMKAYGMSDMMNSKALMKKILTQDPSDSKSLVNTLPDSRYKAFQAAFDFYGKTDKATSQTSATTGVVDKFVQQKLEDNSGQSNQGVQLALYFKRQAPNVTSMYGVLADKNLLKVVRTAYDIPEASGVQSIDKQAAMLKKYIDPADFKDATKMQKLMDRFAAKWDMGNATQASPTTIFDATPSAGVGIGLLATLQNLKLGGV